ncbi:MAG: hypothetical protein FWD42_05845 [Solirubrobacterales bacterium]|nr:hypothetical protein [Solirubrobacterales bacterium]
MGSLEFAIRDHLELRRLHGADPAQVAREEAEALSPAEPLYEWPEDAGGERPALFDGELAGGLTDAAATERDGSGPREHTEWETPPGGESTEEFDVESILEGDPWSPVRAGRIERGAARDAGTRYWSEEAIDWSPSP